MTSAVRLAAPRLAWKVAWARLPMVFAVWAGDRKFFTKEVADTFRASYEWGVARTEEMIQRAGRERGFPEDVARDYLTRRIVYKLSARHLEGLAMFRSLNRALEPAVAV